MHNQPYSFFHEKSFKQRLADALLPEYLIFAVLASAVRFSDDPYFIGIREKAISSYASESWRQIVSIFVIPESDPDLSLCQAVTLLSIIDFTGKPLSLPIAPPCRTHFNNLSSWKTTSWMAQDWIIDSNCPRSLPNDGAKLRIEFCGTRRAA